MFIKKGISGKDMSKNFDNLSEDKIPKVPEAQVGRFGQDYSWGGGDSKPY